MTRARRPEPRRGIDTPLPRWARRTGTVLAWTLGVALVLGVGALAWVAVRGALAYSSLTDARTSAASITSDLGDPAKTAAAITRIAASTRTAHELTSDPVWKAVETLPWLGPQLSAVSTVASSLDTVAASGLAPLGHVASSLSAASFTPHDGRIDLAPFSEVQQAAASGARSLTDATRALARISTPALVSPLQSAVSKVGELLAGTRDAASAMARASVLLPAMLGADGPRNYLVLFQNTAEWRSLGGMPGAQVLIHTEGGRMTLAGQDAASAFPPNEPPLALPDEVSRIFGSKPGVWMHDVTQVPDFTVGAPLAAEMWQRKHGDAVDGVIAIDPVALSYLLAATGPVKLSTGDTLTSENAVKVLLNDVYLRYAKPTDQDRFFTDATSAVFAALAAGKADDGKLLKALTRSGDEHRLLLWSRHTYDQSVLADTTLAGGLPVSDATATRFGVFLNDGTGSKMDYYQSASSAVAWTECSAMPGGTVGTATLSVALKNDAPASGLPDYITGAGAYGVTPGSARTVVYVYLPQDAELLDASVGADKEFGGATHEGRRVLTYTVTLAPGESATAHITVALTKPGSPTLAIAQTPTVNTTVTAARFPNL